MSETMHDRIMIGVNKLQHFLTRILVVIFVATSVIAPLPSINPLPIRAFASTGDDYVAGKASTLLDLKWDGRASVVVNNNKPQIKKRYLNYKKTYIRAAGLDKYQRPHTVRAVLGPETLNNGYRAPIGEIKPVGWRTVKYPDIVEDLYVFNCCHLIGQAVSAGKYSKIVNSKLNLVTGTRYMNFDGMLPYENELLDYLRLGKGHVVYQVTPLYKDDELICRGVWMQAYSMEDKGKAVSFNVYCFNIQPGIEIDYGTGDTSIKNSTAGEIKLALKYGATSVKSDGYISSSKTVYVINLASKKFHLPSCESVKTIKPKNMKKGRYDRKELIEKGYKPCKTCKP